MSLGTLTAATDHQPGICQVLHSLNVGGAEVLAARLARQLQDQFRFTFVCLDELGTLGTALRDEGFPVWLLERRPGVDTRCLWRLARVLRRERVDLVHAHQFTPYFYALSTRVLGSRRPVIFTEHGRHFPDYPRPKRMLFNRVSLGRRDRVVAVGEAVKQALIANEGLPAGRVDVIFNGVDLSPFRPDPAARARIRRELQLGPDDFVMVQVARLDPLKDHATALRILQRLVAQQIPARLVIVGEGPLRSAIETEMERLQLGGAVRLTGLRRDIPDLLAAADACLLTSISEGIPLTLIEAMGAELPVVATNVGGVGEVVNEGATGLLAPSGDDEALAAALGRLSHDPALRRRLGTAGRERAEAFFSEERMHDEYRKLYATMLASRTRQRNPVAANRSDRDER